MTKKNFVFVISLFALFAVDSAWANDTTGTSVGIAAVSYVDRALEPYATKTELENAKPGTATDTAAGLTKLYNNSGAQEDGTMTQKAITNQLANRLPVDGTAAKATADAEGNVITTTYATKTELAGKQDDLVPDTNIKGAGSVTVTEADGVITVTGGTPGTATDTAAGLTKLYNNTGAREDGTMTQKAITNQLANKQGVITDLEVIRSGAQAGATALQPGDVGELALIDVITDSDIADDAHIGMGKIDGLQEALAGKLSASDYGYIPTNENGTGEARIWVE